MINLTKKLIQGGSTLKHNTVTSCTIYMIMLLGLHYRCFIQIVFHEAINKNVLKEQLTS